MPADTGWKLTPHTRQTPGLGSLAEAPDTTTDSSDNGAGTKINRAASANWEPSLSAAASANPERPAAPLIEAIKEHFARNPKETIQGFAKKFNVSRSVAGKYIRILRIKGEIPGYVQERGSNSEITRRRKKIKELFDQNPTIRIVDVARTLGSSYNVVANDVDNMRREGVLPERPTPEIVAFGPAIRAAILDDPTATKAEIAKICGCSVNAVDQVRRKMRERNEISRCDPHEEPFNALEDQRVLREPWYVAEVCGRGFPGMKLPQEYWARYLRFYEMKKKGILL